MGGMINVFMMQKIKIRNLAKKGVDIDQRYFGCI